MPPTQYSSFDRGFDTGHTEVQVNPSPVLEREFQQRTPSRAPWRKFLAFAMVAIMTVAALAVVIPSGQRIVGGPQSPEQQMPAETEIGGTRNVTYTVSNMFEIYNKSTNYADRGKHLTPGFPMWWFERKPLGSYPDTIVRNSYPYMMLYDYYSANIPASYKDPRMGFGTYSFFRLNMNAQNLSTVATGINKDPYFIPILNPSGLATDGGWVNWTWRLDYLTAQECVDVTAGNHYATSYYGVPAGAVTFSGGNSNDGWWVELYGAMDFNVNAAKKFLNLPGTGDLRTEFTTANAGGAVDTAWATHWSNDGSTAGTPDGIFNPYCTYDYQINSGTVDAFLTLDPSSTATKLVLRIWGHAWGYEILMNRMLETVGVGKFFQNYPEDMYFNGTAAPNGADLFVRQTAVYHMLAWKDLNVYASAWNMDTWHTDGCTNTLTNPPASWASRYQLYGLSGTRPQKMEWSPGTVNFGTRVMYWQVPQGFNLTANEKVVVQLPSGKPGMGINLYTGASDVIDQTKAAEIRSNSFWGEVVLGHGYPSLLYSSTYYNHATKTLTLQGPLILNSDPNENPPLTPTRWNETGSPDFVFAVSKVSTYLVEMVENQATYDTTITYNVRVTAKNYTGVTVTTWNGTVNLATNNAGTVFGASSHTYVPGDNGVWQTTVVFGEGRSNTYINATDGWFPLDVTGSAGPLNVVVIPEFPMLVLPVMGAAALIVFFRKAAKKK